MQTEEEGYQSSSTEGPDRYLEPVKGLSHRMKKKFSQAKNDICIFCVSSVCCICKGIVSQDKTNFLSKKLTSVSSVCTLHCFLLDKLKLKLLFASVKHEKRPKKPVYVVHVLLWVVTLDFFFMFSKTPMNIYIYINFCSCFFLHFLRIFFTAASCTKHPICSVVEKLIPQSCPKQQRNRLQCKALQNEALSIKTKNKFLSWNMKAVFRICHILLRIRILGSVPLTKGSGSGSGSCSFCQLPSWRQLKYFVMLIFWKTKRWKQLFNKLFKTESIPFNGVSSVIIWNLNRVKFLYIKLFISVNFFTFFPPRCLVLSLCFKFCYNFMQLRN